MRKMILSFMILLGSIVSLSAQTYDEWFRQKKTQLKYLAQQIAALQVYEGYLHKGYTIATKGLNVISDLKNGEFNLHQVFFSSLSKVNPSIKHYCRIAEIILLQADILEQYKKCFKHVQQSKVFNNNEIEYIYTVFTALLNDCANNISHLIALTTDGQLQLGDDKRLECIDAIYKDMQSNYLFAKTFSNEASTLTLSEQKEQSESAAIKTLYNFK